MWVFWDHAVVPMELSRNILENHRRNQKKLSHPSPSTFTGYLIFTALAVTISGPATWPTPPLRKWKMRSSDLRNNFLLQTQVLVRLNFYSRAGVVSHTKEPFKAATLACRSAWILSKLSSTHGENQSVYWYAFMMLQNVCERGSSSSRLLSK